MTDHGSAGTAGSGRKDGQRFEYVDLIRGLSAMGVLVAHYRWFYANGPDEWRTLSAASLPMYGYLWPLYEHGGLAVQAFWALSGFVFGITYGRSGSAFGFRRFWINRLARLYPLHFAMLILVAIIQIISMTINGRWTIYGNNDLPHFILQILMASNWFMEDASYNAVIWSVSIEIVIYMAFSCLVAQYGTRLRVYIPIFLYFVLIERLTKNPIAQCGMLFFYGATIADLGQKLQGRLGKDTVIIGLAGVFAFIALCIMINIENRLQNFSTLFCYVGIPSILFALSTIDYNYPMKSNSVVWLGKITYSMYLIHMPIIILFKTLFPYNNITNIVNSPITFLSYIVLVVILSLMTYSYLEMPLQSFARRYLSRKFVRE